jgi:hypothetical protein
VQIRKIMRRKRKTECPSFQHSEIWSADEKHIFHVSLDRFPRDHSSLRAPIARAMGSPNLARAGLWMTAALPCRSPHGAVIRNPEHYRTFLFTDKPGALSANFRLKAPDQFWPASIESARSARNIKAIPLAGGGLRLRRIHD